MPAAQQLSHGRRFNPAILPKQNGQSRGAASAGPTLHEAGPKQESAQPAVPSSSEIELQDVDPSYHGTGDIHISVKDEAAPLYSSEAAAEAGDADGRFMDFSEHAPLLRA